MWGVFYGGNSRYVNDRWLSCYFIRYVCRLFDGGYGRYWINRKSMERVYEIIWRYDDFVNICEFYSCN